MNTQDERKAFENIQNEIQSWIAVNSEHSCQLAGDAFVVGANELAEFVNEVFKKLEGCVVVPVEPTDEWMANYIDSGVENYCEEFIGQKFAVKEHEKPFIKEEWRGPVRKAHALILKVVEAARGGNEH